MAGKITRKAHDPSEYKEVLNAAETLGLEPTDHEFRGGWVSDEGHPAFLDDQEIEKVGRKYFHIRIDDRTVPVQPKEYRSTGRGKVVVELEG